MHDVGGIFIFAGVVVMVGIFLYYRHKRFELVHMERMAAMEKGVALPVFQDPVPLMDPVGRNLLYGMIWLFAGAGLTIFLFATTITWPQTQNTPLSEREAKVEVLRKLGASEDELRRVINERVREYPRAPIGLGTLGFIPMGIGLAYLAFYSMERKRHDIANLR